MNAEKRHHLLQVLVLASFAVGQPLYDLLARQPDFFIARQAQSADILLAIVSISIIFPLLIALPGLLLGRAIRAATVALLAGLFCAVALVQYAQPSTTLFFLLTAIATIAFATLACGKPWLINLVKAISPAVLLFPLIFVFVSPIEKLVIRPAFDPPKSNTMAPIPVVMVIFDELPLVSLLDRDGNIDKERYPGFYDLGMHSTWFSRTTTVAEHTLEVLPAMLSGMYPQAKKIPDFVDHPNNLFTLLSASHDLNNVNELMTSLCPQALCWNRKQINLVFSERAKRLLADLGVLYVHKALPATLRTGLPPINHAWGGFLNASAKDYTPREPATSPLPVDHHFRSLSGAAPGWFLNFLDRLTPTDKPGLHFIHVMMPHYPWQYLPDGRTYLLDSKRVPGLNTRDTWGPEAESSREGYQRHILQVGFADRMVSELMSRLRETGLLERSMIVVTADHGASFTPGTARRLVTPETAAEIMYVPLLIKTPGQSASSVDERPADLVDVLPTIVAELSESHAGEFDGHSLFQHPPAVKQTKFLTTHGTHAQHMLDTRTGLANALTKKTEQFGDGKALYGHGELRRLVGTPHTDYEIVNNISFEAEIEDKHALRQIDLSKNHLPSHVSGRVLLDGFPKAPIQLVLSINGIIGATRELTPATKNEETQFSAILPRSFFVSGENKLDVFLATQSQAGSLQLSPARKR